MENKKHLLDLVTKTIFQSSVMHAAVNFLQFEYGIFAPNVPALMRGRVPNESDRGKIDMNHILSSLPGLRASLVQAGAAFTLSEFSKDEVYLLPTTKWKPPRWLFTDEKVDEAYQEFISHLKRIEADIKTRNNALECQGKVPYEVLMPSKIPYGIAI